MRVQEEKHRSTELFFQTNYWKFRTGKVPVYLTSEYVLFPYNFCNVVKSAEELTADVFLRKQYWQSKRALLAIKNKYPYKIKDINQFNIQREKVI